MLVITTIYASQVGPVDATGASAMPDAAKIADLPGIIKSKLMEDPDPNRTLVTVYAGKNRVTGGND